jgi:hypothetical protein
MIDRCKAKKIFMIMNIFICVVGFSGAVSAANIQPEATEQQSRKSLEGNAEEQIKSIRREFINHKADGDKQVYDIKNSLSAQGAKTAQDFQKIYELVYSQKNIINTLSQKIENLSREPRTFGTTFEVWTGTLLAISALLLGAVGIGVALLSFVGYKEIIIKGEKKAAIIASEAAEEEVNRLIDVGAFDTVVIEAMDRVRYRDIMPGAELNEGED